MPSAFSTAYPIQSSGFSCDHRVCWATADSTPYSTPVSTSAVISTERRPGNGENNRVHGHASNNIAVTRIAAMTEPQTAKTRLGVQSSPWRRIR